MNERFNLTSAMGLLRMAQRHPAITLHGIALLVHAEFYLLKQLKALDSSSQKG